MIFKDSNEILVALLILFTNFGITSSFDTAYLVNIELFPTLFLATVYGGCNIVGRLITILSPQIARLPHPYSMLIMTIFAGTSSILGIFLVREKNE